MDWIALQTSFDRMKDRDLPERAHRLMMLEAVLDGKQYDQLPHPFSTERDSIGQYIPLAQRRPSARTNLCRIVVDDAVSLLFSEGHFPKAICDDTATQEALQDLVKDRAVNDLMVTAATRGSVGSVAVLFRVLKNKPFFSVKCTRYLTPEWDAEDPDRLLRVTEKFKVEPQVLNDMGYNVDPRDGTHWFMREWTEEWEQWFKPWPVSKPKHKPAVDKARSVQHGLGFVPIIWTKNLSNGEDVDGLCTFALGIDTVIEADYLLSQGGRGLKYASDPTLVLIDASTEQTEKAGGAANALVLPPESDAKLLEINGTASKAVLEHVEKLRQMVLEQLHGNRTDSDKLSAASSGRAMEMMNQTLIWLADRMRISYGEGLLASLYRMVCEASAKIKGGLLIGDKTRAGMSAAGLTLHWPPWYAPTQVDKREAVGAIVSALQGGVMSRETAVESIAPLYDVEDVKAELAGIAATFAEEDARLAKQAAQTQAKETVAS